jgi:hypothetical protein
MKMYTSLKAIMIALSLLVSMNVSANLIFNFEENLSDKDHKLQYTLGDYTLTVKAFDADENNPTQKIDRSINGLGVNGKPNGDNIGKREYLLFELDKTFFGNLNIVFNLFGNNEKAKIKLNDGDFKILKGNGSDVWTAGTAGINSFTVKGHNNASFRVGEVALVPEPSSLALLSLALFGMGFARFRKTSI